MKKTSNLQKCFSLFLTFFKIGLFTFGGGYAMIPIIQKEVIEKKKWINELDLLDIITVAESTPGPIAVNTATFVGYRVAGFFGSLFATIGLAIPSFVIIFIVSLFYKDFITNKIVANAFKGLQVGVILLLINAVLKLKKSIKLSKIGISLFVITLISMVILEVLDVFNIFSIPSVSIIFIALGIIIGLIIEAFNKAGTKNKEGGK